MGELGKGHLTRVWAGAQGTPGIEVVVPLPPARGARGAGPWNELLPSVCQGQGTCEEGTGETLAHSASAPRL